MREELQTVFDLAPDELRREILAVVWIAIHKASLERAAPPESLPTDLSFTLSVALRMFQRRDVAEAWRAARGPGWLEE